MAIEYKLSYTASEIDKRLGKVSELTNDVADLDTVTTNMQTQLNNKVNSSELTNYYTKKETDDMELISVDEIDEICGVTT